jgi:hypothetical protein
MKGIPMIWHIFKKDWRLLWPFVAGVAAVHFSVLATMLRLGHFHNQHLMDTFFNFNVGIDRASYSLAYLLPLLATLASAFLIAMIVQQEAIPGVRQDWLVRPINRRDLVVAKILSVAIMVQVPVLIADVLGALLNGFPLAQSLNAAVGRSTLLWLTLTFPTLAFVSLARNITEAIVGASAIFFARSVLLLPLLPGRMRDFSPLDWINDATRIGFVLIGAVGLLAIQYSRRKTFLARCLMAIGVLIYWLTPPAPWLAAIASEHDGVTSRRVTNSVEITFVRNQDEPQAREAGASRNLGSGDVAVILPLRTTGLAEDSILNVDGSTVRFVDQDGHAQDLGHQMGFRVWTEEPESIQKTMSYIVRVPRDLFFRFANQTVQLEIDFTGTQLRLTDSQRLPAERAIREAKNWERAVQS